jgi:TolA-binding protein
MISRTSTQTTLVALLLCAGCWTSKSDGDLLKTSGDARDRRITQLEEQNRVNREELADKVRQLEEVLERATGLLARNSADVGAQTDQMAGQVAQLQGQIEELRHDLKVLSNEMNAQRAELEQKIDAAGRGGAPAISASDVPSDKKAHFDAAYHAYETGEYEKSRALFREYVKRYPTDDQAGNAQYWIGSSYLQQNKPATALGEYRKVIADFGKSSAVNVALFGMADAFFRLRSCTDAKAALEALLKRKPSKALKDRAVKLQTTIKRAKTCTS